MVRNETRMKAAICLACLLSAPASAWAQDQIVGLLLLPEVFGSGACDRFAPQEIPLHAAPDSGPIIGFIRVDANWTFHPVGGCDGLTVNVHSTSIQEVRELPTREAAYEAPAAIVLEQRGRWYNVRPPSESGWLSASERDEFLSLEQLLTQGLTYLTEAAEGRLTSAPDAAPGDDQALTLAPGRPVRVVEFRRVDDRLWVRVEVLSHSICESTQEPAITARGWMRAHAPSGEPTIWFYSRGC
jgi:hypothetical protein